MLRTTPCGVMNYSLLTLLFYHIQVGVSRVFGSICIGAQFLSGGLCNLNKKSREKTHVASINSLLLHSSLILRPSSLITLHSSLFTLHFFLITHHSSLIALHSSSVPHPSSFVTPHSSLFTIHSSLLIPPPSFKRPFFPESPGLRSPGRYVALMRTISKSAPVASTDEDISVLRLIGGINGKKWAKVALKSERTNIKGKKLRFCFVKLHKKSSYKLT